MKKLLCACLFVPSMAFCSEKIMDFSNDFLFTQAYVSEEYVKTHDKLRKAELEQKKDLEYIQGYNDALYDVLKYMVASIADHF